VRRDRATELLIEMLRRLDARGGWQLDVVQELYLFGSYARGALNPGDVDVAVEFDHEHPEWKQHFLTSFSYGGDPHATLRMALPTTPSTVPCARSANAPTACFGTWSRREDPCVVRPPG
jgi:hypothetical protein